VRLRGRDSNRDGIGAILRVRVGDLRQMRVVTAGDGYASQYSRVAHFGLGEASVIDELEVTWPGPRRTRQTFRAVPADRFIEIDEHGAEVRVLRAGAVRPQREPPPGSPSASSARGR
jgi:hypothetical protein